MNELPEAYTLARQIEENLTGKTVVAVTAASSPHKFAWYHGDPNAYANRLTGSVIQSAGAYGMMVEITLTKANLLFSDGVRLRWHPEARSIPKKHQLLLEFDDGTHLSASVVMYGGLFCWAEDETFENEYFTIAKQKPSPLSNDFNKAYFDALLAPPEVQKQSLKGALAAEQRIPGLGNGCLQDILWRASLHPRRKTHTLDADEINTLFVKVKETLAEMTHLGGRSTEKDLFGKAGGYPVVMYAKNKGKPCPHCGEAIVKQSYMGGSIYFCPACQPLKQTTTH